MSDELSPQQLESLLLKHVEQSTPIDRREMPVKEREMLASLMHSFTRLIPPKLRISWARAYMPMDDVAGFEAAFSLRPADYAWPFTYIEPASAEQGLSYYAKCQMVAPDPNVKERLFMSFPLNKGSTPPLPLAEDPVAEMTWASATLEERNMAVRLWLNYRKARLSCRSRYPLVPSPDKLPAERRLGKVRHLKLDELD